MRLYGILEEDGDERVVTDISLSKIPFDDCHFIDLEPMYVYTAKDYGLTEDDKSAWLPVNGIRKVRAWIDPETREIVDEDPWDDNFVPGWKCQEYKDCEPEGEVYFIEEEEF